MRDQSRLLYDGYILQCYSFLLIQHMIGLCKIRNLFGTYEHNMHQYSR